MRWYNFSSRVLRCSATPATSTPVKFVGRPAKSCALLQVRRRAGSQAHRRGRQVDPDKIYLFGGFVPPSAGVYWTSAIDREWLELILAAKAIGLTVQEVRSFLHQGGRQTMTGGGVSLSAPAHPGASPDPVQEPLTTMLTRRPGT
nr:anti-repressor SinI family protein [Alicyclobacillus macrosporangiidus]